MYELFKGKIAEQKRIQRLTDEDVAKKAGLTLSTLKAFMCGRRETERTANAIAKALGIER